MPTLVEFAGQLTNGVVLGLLLALVALGFTLVLGVMGIINFAHGLLFTLGAYFAYSLQAYIGFVGALLVAPFIALGLGMLLELSLIRRLYGRDPLFVLLLTLGVAMVGEDAIQMIWGRMPRTVSAPDFANSFIDLGFMLYSEYRILVGGIAAATIVATWVFLEKTPFGAIVRAGAHDSEMMSALGRNLPLIRTSVFGLTAALAAIAGVVAAPLWGVRPQMGLDAILPALIIVVIGGMGSFWGTVLGGILVGVSNSVAVMFIPRFADLSMYVLAIVILLYAPRGLLGKKSVLE